ncbi:MAG: hypothetical protein M0C28_31485 [Candidatus Moduliflexus flocculans]|nr:hypothetical protein [Candidatus Moduliflexus flocculans]
MIIISHRGYWKNAEEKTLKPLLEGLFELGFGVETDIKDLNGKLVISHDPATKAAAMDFEQFYPFIKNTQAIY